MLFSTRGEPIVIKDGDTASRQLAELETLAKSAPNDIRKRIIRDSKLLQAGIAGEQRILFELQNSHMPLCILHDVRLVYEGLSAQVDFIVVTPQRVFIIECKNLVGDIEVTSKGEFIRKASFAGRERREGIYSPIVQNRRHLELIKRIRLDRKGFVRRIAIESAFDDLYRGLVVLANPKTILNARYAQKEVKRQILRVDQLIDCIGSVNNEPGPGKTKFSWKETVELAESFLLYCKEQEIDLSQKYGIADTISAQKESNSRLDDRPAKSACKSADRIKQASIKKDIVNEAVPTCPICGAPMVMRTAKRGVRAGLDFFGCSKYPHCRGVVNIDPEPDQQR